MKKIIIFTILILTVICVNSCEEIDDKKCEHTDIKTIIIEPTCASEGYSLNKCRDCLLEFKSDIQKPYGHNLTKTTTQPTCVSEGYTEYTCDCGYSYSSDHTPPIGHTFSTQKHTPTCTHEGFTKYTCHCGFTYIANMTPPTGHTLKKEIIAPTCTEEGYSLYSCTICNNYSFTSNFVVPLGHNFTATTHRPTSSTTGYTEFHCECGYEYTGDYIMASDIFNGAYVDGTEVLANGADISKWNGDVDFAELKSNGIDYVILKAGSTYGIDEKFEENYKAASDAGLLIGCYYYTYALTVDEIYADAEKFLSFINGKKFDYPVYLDFEDPSQEVLDRELLSDMCQTFIEKMQSKGYFCGLYVNNNWLVNLLDTERITVYFDIWLARWTPSGEPSWSDSFGTRTGMWQYSSTGKIGSHSCDFDLNVSFKDYPSIIKEWGLNGFEKT